MGYRGQCPSTFVSVFQIRNKGKESHSFQNSIKEFLNLIVFARGGLGEFFEQKQRTEHLEEATKLVV